MKLTIDVNSVTVRPISAIADFIENHLQDDYEDAIDKAERKAAVLRDLRDYALVGVKE